MNTKRLLSKVARFLGRSRGPGYIDHFDIGRVAGWVTDPQDSGQPALIGLYIDGAPEMNILADIPREDVQAAGLGPLRCGFDATLPRRLRDGAAHRVELRLGIDGPLLRGGVLEIPGGERTVTDAALAMTAARAEGVAFFEPRRAMLVGWAVGCTHVTLQFDETAPQTVRLDREVPGLGSGSRHGFAVPIPPDLMDGTSHKAQVRFADGGDLLDGAPVEFAITPDRPRVEIEQTVGPRLTFSLRDRTGARLDAPVVVKADGTPLTPEYRRADWTVVLPDGARHLVITHGSGPEADVPAPGQEPHPEDTKGTTPTTSTRAIAPGTVLARLQIERGAVQDVVAPVLPADALSDEACAAAGIAFADFCADPDSRFDPLWYCGVHPGALSENDPALAHYRDTGAAIGLSPGPFFDEITARLLHPDLAAAVDAGRLPCAFALELLHAPGFLGSLPELLFPVQRALGSPAAALAAADGEGDRNDAENRAGNLTQEYAEAAATRRLATLGPRVKGTERRRDPASPPPEPAPIPARLCAPTQAMSPSESIYSAWVSRLDISDDKRAELARDEHALRRDVTATALTRTPLVSIIMPSWNRAFTIGEAIQSVLDQSYSNWELIVSDDASEDKTAEVVRGFDDPRIRYMKFLKSNGAGARNKGLGFARGDYIAYLDSDNIWHPQFLDLMLRQLLANPGSAIAYGAYLDTEIEGAKVVLRTISRPPFRPVPLSSKNFMDLNTIVHHRRVYDWLGGFDNDLPRLQDWDLALRYTSVFRPTFVNRIGVFYRRNVAWGQVTHTQMASGAQNTVNDKTHRRLSERHETLKIDWPARGRVTVLAGGWGMEGAAPTLPTLACAESLARLAAGAADVDLVLLGADSLPAGEDPPGLTRHVIPGTLCRDALRLGNALRPLLQGRPVLSIGMRSGDLRAIPALETQRTFRLHGSGDGTVLQGLGLPTVRFDIGALPIASLPSRTVDPTDLTALVLLPDAPADGVRKLMEQLQGESQRRGLSLLIAPHRTAPWQQIEEGRAAVPCVMPDGVLFPDALGRCAITACLGSVGDLDPFELGLLTSLQGAGVPAAVQPDTGRAKATGFAGQWIDAKAAYAIQVNEPKWIFEKLRKLLADPPGHARLSERSRLVHAIAMHPDLARERLNHALYRMLFDLPQREVIDART